MATATPPNITLDKTLTALFGRHVVWSESFDNSTLRILLGLAMTVLAKQTLTLQPGTLVTSLRNTFASICRGAAQMDRSATPDEVDQLRRLGATLQTQVISSFDEPAPPEQAWPATLVATPMVEELLLCMLMVTLEGAASDLEAAHAGSAPARQRVLKALTEQANVLRPPQQEPHERERFDRWIEVTLEKWIARVRDPQEAH